MGACEGGGRSSNGWPTEADGYVQVESCLCRYPEGSCVRERELQSMAGGMLVQCWCLAAGRCRGLSTDRRWGPAGRVATMASRKVVGRGRMTGRGGLSTSKGRAKKGRGGWQLKGRRRRRAMGGPSEKWKKLGRDWTLTRMRDARVARERERVLVCWSWRDWTWITLLQCFVEEAGAFGGAFGCQEQGRATARGTASIYVQRQAAQAIHQRPKALNALLTLRVPTGSAQKPRGVFEKTHTRPAGGGGKVERHGGTKSSYSMHHDTTTSPDYSKHSSSTVNCTHAQGTWPIGITVYPGLGLDAHPALWILRSTSTWLSRTLLPGLPFAQSPFCTVNLALLTGLAWPGPTSTVSTRP